MEIRIKEKKQVYLSDFPDGWRFSRGDYFKFPVVIGQNNCFIKRFEKKTENIPGWNLLNDLSEMYEPNLSRVYFIAEENSINYVFFEYIEGKTLYDHIAKKTLFDLSKLTEGLFTALQALQKRKHWYPDFYEKNMFINKAGNFLLIDLDSAQPLKDFPHSEMWGCKDYWALVFSFCKEILHITDISPSYFYGSSFNYMHVVFLILRLKIFYLKEDLEYDDVSFFNLLPHYLNSISPAFKSVFKSIYQNRDNPADDDDIKTIYELIHKDILPLSDISFINYVIKPKTEILPSATILSFLVTDYLDQQAGIFVIASGKTFTLKWDVQNAAEIALYENGLFLQGFSSDQNTLEITEDVFGDQSKKIEYRLLAGNDLLKVESTIIVEIVPPLTNLAILDFSVQDYYEKNNEIYSIESGRNFTLQWNVRNAQKITLLKNGEQTREFFNNETSVILNEEAWDGKERVIEYTLVISNEDESIESVAKTSLKVKLIYQQQDIEEFEVKSYLKKNGNEYIVESGKPFTLGWNLTKARELELLKNGQPFRNISESENNISITETANDGKDRKLTYTLASPATATTNKSSRSVTVIVQSPGIVPPVIKVFKTNKSVIRGSGFFTLSWTVENANTLALYKNGTLHKEFEITTTNLELEENYEGSVKHLRFSLNAGSDAGITRSDTVNITVKPKFPVLKIAGLIAAFLVILAIAYYLIVPPSKNSNESKINPIAFDNISFEDTITLTGTNIPVNARDVEVKFNEINAKIITLTKDTIQAQVPKLKQNSNTNIIVYLQGNKFLVAEQVLYKERPSPGTPSVFASFTGTLIKQNEVVTIKGQNLPLDTGSIQIFMNEKEVKIIQQTPDSVRVIVPSLKEKLVNIIVRMNDKDISLANDVVYQKKEVPFTETIINQISQSVLNEGDIVTISGKNIPRSGEVKVMFNNISAAIQSQTPGTIKVKVPSLGKEPGTMDIIVFANGKIFKAGNKIGYQPQQVLIILKSSQTRVIEGENFFISGKNIPMTAGAVVVLFNNIPAIITDLSPDLIKVVIPHLPPNTMSTNVIVQVNGMEKMVSPNMFYQPKIKIVNICNQVVLSSDTYKSGLFGNKHVEFTLKNNSIYIIVSITVTVNYFQKNGNIIVEEFIFENMGPGKSVKKRSEKDINNDEVKLEVKSVTTKDFGIQKCKP